MTAQALLAEFTERGVTLEATTEGNLRYAPRDKLDASDVERLKEHKEEILRLFSLCESYAPSLSSLSSLQPHKTDAYHENHRDDGRDGPLATIVPTVPAATPTPTPLRKAREQASTLGLVARYSGKFGWISMHDPTEGE